MKSNVIVLNLHESFITSMVFLLIETGGVFGRGVSLKIYFTYFSVANIYTTKVSQSNMLRITLFNCCSWAEENKK